MGNLTLTEQEANALLKLIDLAVKTAGLPVAGSAEALAQKIHAASPNTLANWQSL
jgi:hypothetical protein